MIRMGFAMLVMLASAAGVPNAQRPSAPGAPAHNTFLLAGCLQAPPPGTSAFRLTDAKPIGQAPPVGPALTEDARGAVAPRPAYLLLPVSGLHQSGVRADALKLHVGQSVEVTVRPVETVAPAAPTEASPTPVPSAPMAATPQPFSVIDIKPNAGTCG